MLRRIIFLASEGRGPAAKTANIVLRGLAATAYRASDLATKVGLRMAVRAQAFGARADAARNILQQSQSTELLATVTAPAVEAAPEQLPPSEPTPSESEMASDAILHNNLRLADHLISASRLPEAIKCLQSHMSAQPRDTAVAVRLADLHLKVGDPLRARDVLIGAADAAPDNAEANARAATLVYEIFRIGMLVDDFSKRFGDSQPSALVRYFRDKFDMRGSQRTITRLLSRISTMPVDSTNRYQVARAQLLLGMFYYAIEDYQRAELAFNLTARSGINFPWCGYMLGLLAERVGDTKGAMRAYERSVMAHPRFAPAHERLGHLLRRSGSVELAAIHFDAALDGIRIGVDILGSDADPEQGSARLQLRMKRLAADSRAGDLDMSLGALQTDVSPAASAG